MASTHEKFWQYGTYAVVGHSSEKAFPKLTYGGLKAAGKQVFAVDPSAKTIEGDQAYPDLASLPQAVDAVVLEVPPIETAEWVERTAEAGIGRVWIHQRTETPDAIALAQHKGLEVHTGGCAVMYCAKGFNAHTIHKGLWRLLGKY